MGKRRVFDKYPKFSRMAGELSEDNRTVMAIYHRVIMNAFEAYVNEYPTEAAVRGVTSGERTGALNALREWRRTLHDMAQILADPNGEADWCCAPGMMAWPGVCPRHGEVSKGHELH